MQEVVYEGKGTLCIGCGRISHILKNYTHTPLSLEKDNEPPPKTSAKTPKEE